MKAAVLAVLVTVGCGSSADVDPIGTIKANVLYGAGGTCGKNGTLGINVTIQMGIATDYFVTVGNPDLMQVGSVLGCDSDACTIDMDQRKIVGADSERWHAEVKLAGDDTATGAGTYERVMGGAMCDQPITFTGTRMD